VNVGVDIHPELYSLTGGQVRFAAVAGSFANHANAQPACSAERFPTGALQPPMEGISSRLLRRDEFQPDLDRLSRVDLMAVGNLLQ
jgi:hypothetical protein